MAMITIELLKASDVFDLKSAFKDLRLKIYMRFTLRLLDKSLKYKSFSNFLKLNNFGMNIFTTLIKNDWEEINSELVSLGFGENMDMPKFCVTF